MRLSKPLLQLPIRFDAEKLAADVEALPPSAWMPHPTGYAGNDAVPLVSPGGALTDGFDGPMGPTEHLKRCSYILDLMAELDCVWGRSRLMGLGAGADVPIHIDVHYYWRTHRRLHIPVITNPGVLFTCNGETVHMQAGECWLFDSFALHKVENRGSERRVHLVLDTVGGEKLWDLVDAAENGARPPEQPWSRDPAEGPRKTVHFEQLNTPKVMSPWEMRQHLDYLLAHAPGGAETAPFAQRLDRFLSGWQAAWSRFGPSDEGMPTYRNLVQKMREELKTLKASDVTLVNEQSLALTIDALVLWNAVERPPAFQRQRAYG